jgi:leucine dehydrogenase
MDNIIELHNYIKRFDYENINFYSDSSLDLFSIVAVHSTKNGPAIGGCRCIEYDDINAALEDALKLSKAMSYKSSIHNLPHGGAKAVILKPKKINNRKDFFKKYASFVNDLNGKYITSVDSGTSISDMTIVKSITPHVLGMVRDEHRFTDDPSIPTARGVMQAIKAAVSQKLNKPIDNCHIAIQGAGNVGSELCRLLVNLGAKVSIADADDSKALEVAKKNGATAINCNDILQIECDLLSPCALGGVITKELIPNLKCKIICGAANNQLADDSLSQILHDNDILFIPDYLANGGGLIFVASNMAGLNDTDMLSRVDGIYDRVIDILKSCNSSDTPLSRCNYIAEQNLR